MTGTMADPIVLSADFRVNTEIVVVWKDGRALVLFDGKWYDANGFRVFAPRAIMGVEGVG